MNHLEELAIEIQEKCMLDGTTDSAATLTEDEKESGSLSDEGIITLFGNEDCIKVEQVKDIFDERSQATSIQRLFLKPQIDFISLIERICCFDPGTNIQYLAWDKIDRLLEGGDFSIYKAEFDADISPELAHSLLYNSDLELLAFEDVEKSIEAIQSTIDEQPAHQPLHLKGVRRGMIHGPTGLLLAKEYQAPWKATIEKRRMHTKGKLIPEEFRMTYLNESDDDSEVASEVTFTRVEKYKTGRVHNFESILCTMSKYYGVPFRTTADLMQKMYLK